MMELPELPAGWMWPEGYEGEALLCPCPEEYAIEIDGTCPNGCVSPFVEEGIL